MPLDIEDASPPDNPARALTRREVTTAQKQQQEMMQPAKATVEPPPQPSTQQPSPGSKEIDTQSQSNAQAQPEQKQATNGSKAQLASQGITAPASEIAPSGQSEKGAIPALHALVDGLGALGNDPAWMEHPLLRLFADDTSDPGQMSQDLWGATQWWGRVVNAAFDPNAIHAAAANIQHDNSVQGQIAQRFFGINDTAQSQFFWNIMPYALTAMSEWQPWLWMPAVAAGAPEQLNQVPQAAMALFGNDLKHPQFKDPQWYARMGAYVVAAAITAKGGGKAIGPLMKFDGRFKLLEPFANHADRLLGGPGTKTPIKGPDGVLSDPNLDPFGHDAAQWWHDGVEALQPGESPIGKVPVQAVETLVKKPGGKEGDIAYEMQSTFDKTALPELAQKLGITPRSTLQEVRDRLVFLADARELPPALSQQILDNWDRYGPAVDMWKQFKYHSAGEADFHDAFHSLKGITDQAVRDHAFSAMRAANGFHADLHSGVHSYGNNLLEALTKGVLSHSRSTDHYGREMLGHFEQTVPAIADRRAISLAIEDPYLETDAKLQRLRDLANNAGGDVSVTARQHALEELNQLEGGEGVRVTRYDSLSPHAQWALDFARRLMHEVSVVKQATGVPGFRPQPNFVYRVPVQVENLEKVLKGVGENVRLAARQARSRTPFGTYHREHRSVVLVGDATDQAGIHAETAGKTTAESNAARDIWRNQMRQDLLKEAESNPALKAITDDAKKFNALLQAELPAFSTDILDSMKAMLRDVRALQTHQVMEEAKRTLVLDPKDGRWHPLAVARSEAGQESSPALAAHFKELHSSDTTSDFYSSQMGYRNVQGLQSGGYIFHPRFAEPINSLYDLYREPDAIYKALRGASGLGKHLIMLNAMWHATNMAGRFAWLAGTHPVQFMDTLLQYKGIKGAAKNFTDEQKQTMWDAQEREFFNHGGVTPQLHEDVTQTIGKNHMGATGDIEVGQPLDVKAPLPGFSTVAADALDAVKGADAWWQTHVNDRFWHQYRQFATLAYIVTKEDALKRGMGVGDARLYAASRANRLAGMTTPDRWMYNPFMYKASQLALFAPNWWRTFPGIVMGTYDRMGMASNPALTHAWALNTAKTVGAMFLVKAGADNLLNYMMSGHWQFQNPQGYQGQITMDNFFPPNPDTGAHHVMEDPFERQPHDLIKALGIDEAMKYGQWRPEYAQQGTTEVVAARMSPLLQAMETASNFDVYNTLKQRALKWVDPRHPGFFGSGEAAAAGLGNLTPMGYAAQAALQGTTAQPGTLEFGPWKGTQVPGWAMRAFDPNDPMVPLLSLLGTRGGYEAPIRTDERGLSSAEQAKLGQYRDDWRAYLNKQQAAVMAGGMTWADFAQHYRQESAAYANRVKGATDGTSEYMQGASGLLSQYEAIYNDPTSFDANGDINWKAVQQAQDQLQATTDPGTWRQMIALKDKNELKYPVLHVYKDTLRNYHNFQDTEAKALNMDGETLRSLIAQAAASPDFRRFEAQHPELAAYYAHKRTWELNTKQGFAYGLFTNNNYVIRVIAPSGTPEDIAKAEGQVLPQIQDMEKAGTYVTESGQ